MPEPLVPDLIQAVLGYRTWAIDAEGWLLPFSLAAIAGPWRPGINHATCHYAKWRGTVGGPDPAPPHEAPDPRCMCGLYALLDPRDRRLPRDDATVALGAVGAWGEIDVHRSGFRAQYATVLALAVPPRAASHLRRRHERAAERYGVDLVAPDLLEAFGRRHAAPVPPSLLPAAARPPALPRRRKGGRRTGAHSAAPGSSSPATLLGPAPAYGATDVIRGLRPEEHLWFEVPEFRCGITGALADHLGPGPVDLTLPAVGTHHRTSDALAHLTGSAGETLRVWPPLSATVVEVNPALADDPGLLLRDPEGAGWLARLEPTDWTAEAGGIEWGPAADRAYRTALAEPDPWRELRATTLRVQSAQEVLAELRRRRALPRFPDAAAVHEQLVAPLAAALDREPATARALARLGRRVRFRLHEPSTGFTLDASGPMAFVGPDGAGPADAAPEPADVTFSLSAITAEQLLTGRLDVARAVRSGTIRADLETTPTLAVLSILRRLPDLPVRPGGHGPSPP